MRIEDEINEVYRDRVRRMETEQRDRASEERSRRIPFYPVPPVERSMES